MGRARTEVNELSSAAYFTMMGWVAKRQLSGYLICTLGCLLVLPFEGQQRQLRTHFFFFCLSVSVSLLAERRFRKSFFCSPLFRLFCKISFPIFHCTAVQPQMLPHPPVTPPTLPQAQPIVLQAVKPTQGRAPPYYVSGILWLISSFFALKSPRIFTFLSLYPHSSPVCLSFCT